jgi:Holliday junction resolvasome RuvABC DNA-binding subunit
MKIKEWLLLIGIIMLLPIFSLIALYSPARADKSHPYLNKVDNQKITEVNFVGGKRAALENAKRFLSYEYYNKDMLKEDLKALGYSDKEIKYAIKSVQGL